MIAPSEYQNRYCGTAEIANQLFITRNIYGQLAALLNTLYFKGTIEISPSNICIIAENVKIKMGLHVILYNK